MTLHSIPLHCITLHYNTKQYNNIRYIHKSMHAYIHTITYHYIPLHTITYHYIPLHTITYRYIPLHTITYHYIPLHTITYHYVPLHTITYHYIPLHYTTLHYITLHYTTLHNITSHYITSHYITLHYIHTIHTYIHAYIHTYIHTYVYIIYIYIFVKWCLVWWGVMPKASQKAKSGAARCCWTGGLRVGLSLALLPVLCLHTCYNLGLLYFHLAVWTFLVHDFSDVGLNSKVAATTNYAQQYGQAEASVKLQVEIESQKSWKVSLWWQPVACGHFWQVDHWDDVDTQTDSKTFEEAVAVDGCQWPRVAASSRRGGWDRPRC